MVTVGVTGTMGSGKTTLCRVWEELGAVVVYADELARELMICDSGLKESIRRSFGDKSYLPDGSLNREYLAREAFGSGRVEELNSIVHPTVGMYVEKRMNQARREGAELFAEEAALLLLNGRPPGFDVILLVRSPFDQQMRRVEERDRFSRQEILSRMENQPAEKEMFHLADQVIDNDADLETFRRRSSDLYRQLVRKDSRSHFSKQ